MFNQSNLKLLLNHLQPTTIQKIIKAHNYNEGLCDNIFTILYNNNKAKFYEVLEITF